MAAKKIDQYMKPHGEEGIKTIKDMNEEHRHISEFAFESVDVGKNDKILDIGCGGGANIEKFLKLTENNVDGLDYSDISVQESIKRNQKAIDGGRCSVIQGDVSDMPIDDESYDLISAFSTIYFWPELDETFKEVARVIKPKGRFMIAQGTDGNHPDDEKWISTIEGMRIYNAGELNEYLLNAGFNSIENYKKKNEHLLVIIAQK
ncbi:class I SAM-dependent methyltransferase [Methanobrevibacter sp. V14]|uniref:class I SAM-dependent methyltransferase n=1 Tax=Methanobrevibacter sp. V14 TaxID=3064280 RepID=UPI0027326FCE|nr:class I SAM-dependent methyltransferase [Methanobrevibacter sp. V14]